MNEMRAFSEIIARQRDFFNTNATKNVDFRIRQLKKLRVLLRQNESALYDAIFADFKKSEFDTYATELSIIYHDIDEAIKKVRKWAKIKRVRTNMANLPAKCYVVPEPLGVSLIIGAWNYPYQLSLAPVIAAITAGNTVVLKPSELSWNAGNIMAQLINESFDQEYMYVVNGGVQETTELLSCQFDKIFFTGSTRVGGIVYAAAAKHLTPVTLELGGKSPVIITEGCDLKQAVKRIVWGKYLNSGQTCIAPDYILVEEKVKQAFLDQLVKQIEKNNYTFANDNYVQIINDAHFERLVGLIDKDRVYYGGNYDKEQRLIEPTVLSNISFDDSVMEEEIFGPVLPVISFDDLDKVIGEIKTRPKPLACYVFTNNKSIRRKIISEVSFGGGAVNDTLMHISNSHLPFGGVGASGFGSYHGKAGFKTFSHHKSMLYKPNWGEPDIKYPPYSKKKLRWVKRLLG